MEKYEEPDTTFKAQKGNIKDWELEDPNVRPCCLMVDSVGEPSNGSKCCDVFPKVG